MTIGELKHIVERCSDEAILVFASEHGRLVSSHIEIDIETLKVSGQETEAVTVYL